MKKLLTIFSLIIAFHISFAQGTWTELNGLVGPQPASEIPHIRSDYTGFALNGMVYITTGYNFETGNYYNDIFGYNPSTNRWVQQIPLPASGRAYAQGGEMYGKGFITMGYDDFGGFTDSWEYDPLTMLWSTKAAFPGTVRQEGFSFVINNKFYTGGGIDNNLNIHYSDLWEYDPSLDSWSAKTSLPVGLLGSKTFTIGNSGYVLGGFDSLFQVSTASYRYDQLTDTWTTISLFPGTNVDAAMSDSLFGYAITDTTLYCFDPITNLWTMKAPVPSGVYDAISGNVDSLIYLLSSDGGVLSYNPTSDIWTENYISLGSTERPYISGRSVVISDTAYFKLIKYNINNDNWIVDSLLDVSQWLYSIDSIGYALKGGSYEKFDPANRTWAACNTIPLISADYSFSTTRFGYVLGLTANFTWEFWQYDPLNDVWTIKSNFPGRNQGNGNSFGIGDKGYIAAGLDSNGYTIDDFWEYNESSDAWIQRQSVPGGSRMAGCETTWNNKGVIAFGLSDPVGLDMCDINVYDEITNSWSTIVHSLSCRSGNVIAFSHGGKLFIGQGQERMSMGIRIPFYDFWSYDDGTSAVADLQSNGGFQVYPNPTSGSFTIETTRSDIAKGEIIITDLFGRKVFQESQNSNSKKQNILINVSSGMYLINVFSAGVKIETQKIIIE